MAVGEELKRLVSAGSKPSTLVMDEYLYRLTSEVYCWLGILVSLMGWDSTSIVVWVSLFQESYGIGIVYDTVGFFLVSELGLTLWALLYSNPGYPVGLHFILGRPPESEVRHPGLVGPPLRATVAVPPAGFDVIFLPPIPGTWPTYPF